MKTKLSVEYIGLVRSSFLFFLLHNSTSHHYISKQKRTSNENAREFRFFVKKAGERRERKRDEG